jgi:hypothetical protein
VKIKSRKGKNVKCSFNRAEYGSCRHARGKDAVKAGHRSYYGDEVRAQKKKSAAFSASRQVYMYTQRRFPLVLSRRCWMRLVSESVSASPLSHLFVLVTSFFAPNDVSRHLIDSLEKKKNRSKRTFAAYTTLNDRKKKRPKSTQKKLGSLACLW